MRLWTVFVIAAAAVAVWTATQPRLLDEILYRLDEHPDRRTGSIGCGPDALKPMTPSLPQPDVTDMADTAFGGVPGLLAARMSPSITPDDPDRTAALPADLVDRLMLALGQGTDGPATNGPATNGPATAMGPAPAARGPSPDSSGILLARGNQLLDVGDLASARLFYQRALEQGDHKAMVQLAKTLDPSFLKRMGVSPPRGDPQRAALLYERAAELGEPEAAYLLSALRGHPE